MQREGMSLRADVRGLQVDAQCGIGGVVHLVVRAQQQHEGAWRRLRQHLANALYRAADLCHPGDHGRGVRVVELLVPAAAVDDDLPERADAHVRQVWPLHGANGEAHYQALLIHEGVKRHHDGRPAAGHVGGLGRQGGAQDLHSAVLPRLVVVEADGSATGEVRDAA